VTKPMAKVLLNNSIKDIGHDTQSKSHVKKMCDEIDKIPVHEVRS
jgi:kynurenine formamidase